MFSHKDSVHPSVGRSVGRSCVHAFVRASECRASCALAAANSSPAAIESPSVATTWSPPSHAALRTAIFQSQSSDTGAPLIGTSSVISMFYLLLAIAKRPFFNVSKGTNIMLRLRSDECHRFRPRSMDCQHDLPSQRYWRGLPRLTPYLGKKSQGCGVAMPAHTVHVHRGKLEFTRAFFVMSSVSGINVCEKIFHLISPGECLEHRGEEGG